MIDLSRIRDRRCGRQQNTTGLAIGPEDAAPRVVIDSRGVGRGDLFFGLPGENVAAAAPRTSRRLGRTARGASSWRICLSIHAAQSLTPRRTTSTCLGSRIHRRRSAPRERWRHVLGAKVMVTGSTGKTSTKDILAALLGKASTVVATPATTTPSSEFQLTCSARRRELTSWCWKWRCAARVRST